MNELIEILMKRDNISENEAENLIDCCRAEIFTELAGEPIDYLTYDKIADILCDWLGLEMDYIDLVLE